MYRTDCWQYKQILTKHLPIMTSPLQSLVEVKHRSYTRCDINLYFY
uniref:Uncharacterized protein n=1 Tax=Lepeophtheirus salmonis TaxID=72036 RepID=A0A0K2V447_LEPSM